MNIIEYIPIGHDNAISRKQLCQLTGLPDRLMRKAIERARRDYAILNIDGSGYFQPEEDESYLVERWLRQERSRGKSVEQSMRGAEHFLTGETEENGVVAVRSYVRRKRKDENGMPQIVGQITL